MDALWKGVSEEKKLLARGEDFPIYHSLEESWRVLSELYGGVVDRADQFRHGDTPFEAVMFYLEMGFYPPPELLLALSRAYDYYRYTDGEVSLEEVFFGRARRKAGNHAKRKRAHSKLLMMGVHMLLLLKEGHTKIRAAEIISEQFGGEPEPESIVRMLNAFHARRTK